jgi:hypothetical protein
MMESPHSKVSVSVLKVTTIIGKQETGVAFEARIVAAVNVLVGNYSLTEDHACITQLRHGRFNHVFDMVGVKYQLRAEPVAHTSQKRQTTVVVVASADDRAKDQADEQPATGVSAFMAFWEAKAPSAKVVLGHDTEAGVSVFVPVGLIYPRVPLSIGYGPKLWIRSIPSSGKRLGNHIPHTMERPHHSRLKRRDHQHKKT